MDDEPLEALDPASGDGEDETAPRTPPAASDEPVTAPAAEPTAKRLVGRSAKAWGIGAGPAATAVGLGVLAGALGSAGPVHLGSSNAGSGSAAAAAAGDWLVANGYSTRAQLGCSGLSNGALTVAASVNRSPDTYAAAIVCAMHADNLEGLRDDSTQWVHEYGDARVPEEFEWLLRDSPYHQTKPGICYPATLVCAFGKDTRTLPEEGHKYTALLQWATSCERPIVLRHEEDAGHATRSVDQMADLLADWLGFAAFHLGLNPASG